MLLRDQGQLYVVHAVVVTVASATYCTVGVGTGVLNTVAAGVREARPRDGIIVIVVAIVIGCVVWVRG